MHSTLLFFVKGIVGAGDKTVNSYPNPASQEVIISRLLVMNSRLF